MAPKRIFLKDIEGSEPKITFESILEGANELFGSAEPSFRSWLPDPAEQIINFETSEFKQRVIRLKNYVCEHRYSFANDENEPYEDGLPYYLISDVTSVYELWRWQISSIGQLFNEISINLRYFSLFAQAAKLRFQVDFGALSEFRKREENYEDECYFTRHELGLLSSIWFNENDIGQTETTYKLNSLPTLRKTPESSAQHLPVHREIEYFSKGRKTGNSASLITREDAIKWLRDHPEHYEFTNIR